MMSENGYRKTVGASLRIHCPSLLGHDAKVELDGRDIGHFLQGIEISFGVDDIVKATLKILVSDLDITTETFAVLKAYLEQKVSAGS